MILTTFTEYANECNNSKIVPIVAKDKIKDFDATRAFQNLKKYNPFSLIENMDTDKEHIYIYMSYDEDFSSYDLNSIEDFISSNKRTTTGSLPKYHCTVFGVLPFEAVLGTLPSKNISRFKEELETKLFFSKLTLAYNKNTHEVYTIYNSRERFNLSSDYEKGCKLVERIMDTVINSKPLMEKTNKSQILINTKYQFDEYENMFNKAINHIVEGDIFQVVLSNKFTGKADIDPLKLFNSLKINNPSDYMCFVKDKDTYLLFSSPEKLLSEENSIYETVPIAGTRPVKNDGRDQMRETELISDEKELSEHLMLVDLGRNDLGRVSKPGTVKVKSYGQIKKYSKVMHMVSKVEGIAKDSSTALAGLKSTFPAGTVSGAPKLKAIEIIKNLESDNRDEYAGTVFMHNLANSLDSFISIRFIRIKDKELTIQSGSGIVHDSIAKDEYKEILNKASALFKSVEEAHEGEIIYDFIN